MAKKVSLYGVRTLGCKGTGPASDVITGKHLFFVEVIICIVSIINEGSSGLFLDSRSMIYFSIITTMYM